MSDRREFNALLAELRFFASPEHPCSYLEDRDATTIFVDPYLALGMAHYSLLVSLGFRRSGDYVYRPHCRACKACVPVRIPVADFRPDRSQRRVLRNNQDVALRIRPVEFVAEHFTLYRRYMQTRHPGGGMDKADPEAYMRVLASSWADSELFEWRRGETLLAVAVVDVLLDGLSAVYTFFDPDPSQRGLGNLAVLTQIEQARQRGLPHMYLGYWIGESAKMAYKTRFQPLEGYNGRRWRRLPWLPGLPAGARG